MVILSEDYHEGVLRDWIRAMRLKREAVLGEIRVPKDKRLYIVNDDAYYFIPYDVKVYKDKEGRRFLDLRQVERRWPEWKKKKRYFELKSDSDK